MEFLVATKAGSILGPIASLFGLIMDLLFKFTNQFGVFNIGLCIILFTIITKLILFPITIKQQKSSKLMSLMNPEITAIQKKYKGKTDQSSMAKQQVEMQAVYDKYGSSPTAGCLPMVIQLPIILALYRVIYNIPAYVPSVRVFFDNVVEPLKTQPDYINKIAELASSHALAIDKIDYTNADKIVDLLYKFTPANWNQLGDLFPQISSAITVNAAKIESMNSFFGINLATSPFTGFDNITIAWLIPILAGLTQWLSTKLMNTTQTIDKDAPGAQMMNSMMVTMPLMSVFFCFSFPAAIGIYWVIQAVVQIFQQMAVNSYMKKIDVDAMIQKNVDKMNAKRAKKGLPPAKVTQNANTSLKNIQSIEEKEEEKRREKMIKTEQQVKESSEYYNSETQTGSIASKARMVQKYNDKHSK
ncbi:MAG: YidC/Oxa1 family membrane protein insertase [Clostridium sp.]